MDEQTTRKIVAILFSDIVGYTATMGQDEEQAIRAVSRSRTVQKELVRKYHGDWVQEIGDGALCTFASAVEAVSCALEIQRAFQGDPDFKLRIGIHVGDIVFRKTETGYDVFGDGVNVAARVQGVGEGSGILISERVYDDLRNRKGMEVRFLGEKQLKNVNRPISVYEVIDSPGGGGAAAPAPVRKPAGKRRGWLAAGAGVLGLGLLAALAWSLQGRFAAPPAVEKELPSAAQPQEAPVPETARPPVVRPETAQPPVAQPEIARPPVAPPLTKPAKPAPSAPAKPPPALAFDALRRALLARVGPWGEARARVDTDPNPVPNDTVYRIVFEAQCDCAAMLFAIDGNSDEIALLYPNPYDPPQRLAPGEKRTLPSSDAYSFRAVGGEGVDMLKLFVTPKEFAFPEANINAWSVTPASPERMAELARWLDSLEQQPFATSVTPLQIRR